MNNYGRGRLGGCVVILVILAVVGAGAGIYWGVMEFKHGQYKGPFQTQMAAYLAAADAAPAGTEGAKAPGPVKGKMVVLDTKSRDFDWEVLDGLGDLKAEKPEEVGTIVQTSWAKTHEPPDYDNGAQAFIQECDVTIIDAASHRTIEQRHFRGGEPPTKIESSSEGVGSKPTEDVVNYLKTLPRG